MQSFSNRNKFRMLLLALSFLSASSSYTQTNDSLFFSKITDTLSFSKLADTVDKFDANQKKHGYWLVYLNMYLIPVEDIRKASYYAFDYFEHGEGPNIFRWGLTYKQNASKVRNGGVKLTKGQPMLLSGHFKFYDQKGDISISHTYKNGLPVRMESYKYKKGKRYTKEILDFTSKFLDQPLSCQYEIYGPDNKVADAFYFAKGAEGRWGVVRVKKYNLDR